MMKRCGALMVMGFCLAGAPAVAQTTVGGGACMSSTLTGTYELLLNGRQVAANGSISKIFQAVGTATFDGLSKITLNLTANTVTTSQLYGTPLEYTGTYSLQSNCIGSINITSGDVATFTLESFNSGSTFAVIGSDAAYAYNGTGNTEPATCPTTLTGAHEFSTTGNSLSGASVTGVLDAVGVLSFDGQGNATANWAQVSNLSTTAVAATGVYTVSSGCLASATLTDAAENTYAMTLSLYSTASDFAIAIASPLGISAGSGSTAEASLPAGCSASTMSGTYYLALGGRTTTGGVISKIMAANGDATFDGQGKVTFTVTANTVNGAQAFGAPAVYSGTYAVAPNCQGTINLTGGDTAAMEMVAYSINATTQTAHAFTLVGTDASYAYSGSGSGQPTACAASTLSGTWSFSGTGNSLSGGNVTGVLDLEGTLEFDGQGNATASWSQVSNTATSVVSASGTYSVTGACVGTLTLTDTAGNKYAGSVAIYGTNGANFSWEMTNPRLIFTGTGRTAFGNPGVAVVNAASYHAGETPAGSVFAIFGSDLASKEGQPTGAPLPTKVLTTTVTVNGEAAPLFYVSPTQINAQMPEDTKAGVATVVVTNGNSTSNAVAVTVPAAGTPGIIVYGNNRAVVVNSDNSTVNSATAPAKVGDEVTVYFTGGGPVNAAGALVTGAPSPSGLSPLSGTYAVTVGGVDATVDYIGLTPSGIGLYQANFVVPKVSTGDHALVITIAGQASNNPLIAVAAK